MFKVSYGLVAALVVGLVAGCSEEGEPQVELKQPVTTSGGILYDAAWCWNAVTTCPNASNTHCCPSGMAMVGLHQDRNKFACRTLVGADATTEAGCANQSGTLTLDGIVMKACTGSNYVRGWHQGNQTLHCCPYPATNVPWFGTTVDGNNEPPHQSTDPYLIKGGGGTCSSGTMHTCPNSEQVVRGIKMDSSNNLLACER
jgi:hypothetical protein